MYHIVISLRSSVPPDGEDQLEKSEVQAIIESTPELDMEMDGFRDTRYCTVESFILYRTS